jgi:hypothetical protein
VNGPKRSTRRRFLLGAGGLAAGGAGGAIAGDAFATRRQQPQGRLPLVPLGRQPTGLPVRQHAWEATLAADSHGNPIAPRFDRLLFFDVLGKPTRAHARTLEAALRTLERAYRWAPSGLLFTASWGHSYFEHVLGVPSPVPRAKPLSDFELPSIDDYDLCVHLACDDERRLQAVEAALLHGAPLSGSRTASGDHAHLRISAALAWRETRTGFAGTGLPAAHQHVGGIPAGAPVPRTAPLYMGFRSSLKRNQASEDAVTIPSGPFAEGSMMHVSYMRLRLDDWYGLLNQRERVARMYSPQTTPADVGRLTTDAASDPQKLGEAIRRFGVIGHAQASARARRDGKPLILRRDFDTTDGQQAGLHFVSLQRTIADFITTRNAMNATAAQLQNPAITDTVNNGINEFIFVLKRANYLVPSRRDRSFPLLQ